MARKISKTSARTKFSATVKANRSKMKYTRVNIT
jgi:hypothetical protein